MLIHPTRMALSAASAGPPLFDLIEVMGREATDLRLGRFLAFLKQEPLSQPVGSTAQAGQG